MPRPPSEGLKKRRREYMRRYRAANPEKSRAWQLTSQAKRSRQPPTQERRDSQRKLYRTNPTYRAKQLERTRRNHSTRRYGITLEQRAEIFEKQGSRCAICDSPAPQGKWHTDHCHKNGHVRGVLCHLCNVGLGQFKDNPALLRKAARYLTHNSGD